MGDCFWLLVRLTGMVSVMLALVFAQGRILVERQILGRLPGELIGPILFGPSGQQALCAVHVSSGGWSVFEDGRLVGTYDGKDPIVIIPESYRPGLDVKFSQDGHQYAFVGERSGKQIPVIDGTEKPPHDRIGEIALSPMGGSSAYVAIDGGRSRLIRDGTEAAANADHIGRLKYSPDGRHLAWICESRGFSLFLDGKQLTPRQGDDPKAFQQVHQFLFSPDGRHTAYIQGADPEVRIVEDNSVVATFSEISGGIVQGIDFTPDSKRLGIAYGGIWATQVGFIQNGKLVPAGPARGTTQGQQFIWSPNGEHYATEVLRNNKTCAVLDGVEMPEHVYAFCKLGWVLNDGKFAYCSCDSRDGVMWTTHFGGKDYKGWFLYDIIPDGPHLAMCSSLSESHSTPVQVDGRTYGPEGEKVTAMAFSRPSGTHFFFRTKTATAEKLYVDGVLQPFDGEVSFSPDEHHIAVSGRDRAAVDNVLVFPVGSTQPHLFWDDATRFHGYAIEGDELVRIKGTAK